jgi:outer membrane protein assembly factor BamD
MLTSLTRLSPPAAVLLSTLFGCSWLPDQVDPTEDWSANRFYNEAKEALQDGNYQTAIGHFEKLQARYPFGRYAQQAQIELIYAYYRDGEPEAALAAADRFIRTYPRHPFVDYAYYMKGLINYSRDTGALSRLAPNDPTKTDPGAAKQAFDDFATLVRQFPTSRYAEDARQRMVFLHNNLAAYEINVADYYMRRGAYVAAANRAKYVLENYARTESVPDALAIMTHAYIKLGLSDLARDSLRVLQINHPNSPRIPELLALLNGQEPPSEGFSLFGLSL